MKCGKVRKVLMAYHDGELDPAAAEKVVRHLESCGDCLGLLDALERADNATGSAAVPHPDSSYWDTFTGRVMEKVSRETQAARLAARRGPARSWFSPARFAPALSLALVVVVAAGVLMKIRQPVLPERSLFENDAVVGSEMPPAQEEHVRSDLEGKAAADHSTLQRPSAEEKHEEPVDLPKLRKAEPVPVTGSVTARKETVTDEWEQPAVREEARETGMRFTDKDDSLGTAPPPSPDVGLAGSFMTSPSAETTALSEPLVKAGEPLPTGGAIDDGSWGQLAFAHNLEAKGRHVESEKVLDDLLSRNPAVEVQEQASLLLVSVLRNQNRLPEARQVLEDAQRQYPANMTIQNYRIGNSDQ